MIHAKDGRYYAYATGDIAGALKTHISVTVSDDLVHWSAPTDALPEMPIWANRVPSAWAPHVLEKDGTYYMYYSVRPNWSDDEHMRLGVATSQNPLGPFVDSGSELNTGWIDENIDPMVFKDPKENAYFLIWGRNGIIASQKLTDDLLHLDEAATADEILKPEENLAYEKFAEGPYMIYQDGWYYLFYSGDDCCEAAHYAILVARSKSRSGPFERAEKPVLTHRGRWLGTGHVGILQDADGKVWAAYHAVLPDWLVPNGEFKRFGFVDEMTFVDGWPQIIIRD